MKKYFCFLALAVCFLVSAAKFDIAITSTSKDGLVKKGEVVTVTAAPTLDGKAIPAGYTLSVEVWHDGGKRLLTKVPAEKGYTARLSLNMPGWAFAKFSLLDAKTGKTVRMSPRPYRGSGIFLAPEKMRPSRKVPKDFDAFWETNKKELASVPMKVLEKKKVSINARADKTWVCYDMKIACAGPKPVSGYLQIPLNKSRKYPVILEVAGAGVYDSYKSCHANAIIFNINAHGILNGQPKSYYAGLQKKELKGYPHFGSGDRDKIYFKYMFLRVLRALEYLKTLPEWNGKDIIVRGSSQGGAQTIFAAAMDKDVTLASATVPAMVEYGAVLDTPRRRSGWPQPYNTATAKKLAASWDYYDMANFARKITCPIYISTGLIDVTCPPNGILGMYNVIPAQKKGMEIHRDMGHFGRNDIGKKAIAEALIKASGK